MAQNIEPVEMPNAAREKEVPMINSSDDAIWVASDEVQRAEDDGYHVESPVEESARKWADEQGPVKGALRVAARKAIGQLTLGATDVLEATDDDFTKAKNARLEKMYPAADLIGTGGGFIASMAIGGGALKAASIGSKLAAKVLGRYIAAEAAGEVGVRAATSAAAQILKKAGKGVLSGVALAAPRAISENEIGDKDAAMESLLYGGLAGGIFGGVSGTGKELLKVGKSFIPEGKTAVEAISGAIPTTVKDAALKYAVRGVGAKVGASIGGIPGMIAGWGAGEVAEGMAKQAGQKSLAGLIVAERALGRAARSLDEVPAVLQKLGRVSAGIPTPKEMLGAGGILAAINMFDLPKTTKRDKLHELLQDKAYEMVGDPGAVADKIAKYTAPLEEGGAPEIASLLAQRMTQTHEYILNALPKAYVASNPLMKKQKFNPDKKLMTEFLQKMEVIGDPFVVFKQLKHGTLTRSHMHALKAIYPSLHMAMKTRVHDAITSNPSEVTPSSRVQLSILMDEPMDSSLTPNTFKRTQEAYAMGGSPDEQVEQDNAQDFNLSPNLQSDMEQLQSG